MKESHDEQFQLILRPEGANDNFITEALGSEGELVKSWNNDQNEEKFHKRNKN